MMDMDRPSDPETLRLRGHDMRITERQVALGMQIMILIGLIGIAIFQIVAGSPPFAIAANILGVFLAAALFFAYLRHWRYAAPAIMILSIVLSSFVPPLPLFSLDAVLSLLIPPVTALILGTPAWVLGSAIATAALFVARSGGNVPSSPPFIIITLLLVGGMFLARIITDTALHDAGDQTRRAEDALAHAQAHAQALAAANDQQESQLGQQQQLLNLVASLETHASPLADGVLFAPIVGHLDTRRAEALTGRLLAEAAEQRAKLVILDIAGVSMIDTAVARGLLNTAQALRLLGCAVTLSGISAEVAMTLIGLGIGLENVSTARSPREALASYFADERRVANDA
jgi:anti-anti-sigma regulatory factor